MSRLSVKGAARRSGFSRSHIRYLARHSRIKAKKFADRWIIYEDSLEAYQRHSEGMGAKKHAGLPSAEEVE